MKTLNNKSKLIAIVALILFGSLGAAQTALAQTTLFAYQGKLEFDGAPANGNYDFQFKLFDAVIDGAQQGAAFELLNITVSNGAYTVNLDFGAAVFTGADRFLEVSVRPAGSSNYSTLSPRQQFTSTPYGIRSRVATTADGLSATCANCVTSNQIQSVQGSQVTGNVAGSQINGTIPVASVPAGSGSYIQNALSQQSSSNFNISGNGTAAGTLSANLVNAGTQYNIAGARVLGVGGSSIFVGVNSGLFNSGTDNAFFGRNTGLINTTGSNNSFFGSSTGFGNTTGHDNTFVGNRAGLNNTTAYDNTFVGSFAGQANTSGFSNSFLGKEAGYSNTTGYQNTFVGSSAGHSNTTGQQNSFFGDQTGESNTTGYQNSFFGHQAGKSNMTGVANAFFGYLAGTSNTTGSSNAFFGFLAGGSNTTAIGNAFFGALAGQVNTGASNAFFGHSAGGSNTAGQSNSFFGTGAGTFNTTGLENTFLGGAAGSSNTTGKRNTFVGVSANFTTADPTGNDNTLLGANAMVTSGVNKATAIGASAQALTSNTIVLGTDQETVIVRGKLQVDTLGTIGHDKVCLNNNNRLAPCSSSLRYKTDLQPFAGGMAIINRLQPISYTWKDGGQRDVGFGAEDVHKIEPLLVTFNAQGLVEGVKYDRVTVVLVNAIREQQQQIAAQQTQIEQLKSVQTEHEKLKAQLVAILARLGELESSKSDQK